MARMTKGQARKRLNEAQRKLLAVYMAEFMGSDRGSQAITGTDMIAIEKMFRKFHQRLK